MTFSMTDGTTTITPWDRLGFSATNEARNILHEHLDDSISVSLRADLPQSGTLSLLFLTAAAAEAARRALVKSAVWTVTDDVAEVSMTLVRMGPLGRVQQDARLKWQLDVGFQEVP